MAKKPVSLESRFGPDPRRIGLRASHAAESIPASSFCAPCPARRACMTRFKSGAGHAFRASARIPADKPGSASRSSSAHGNQRPTLSAPGPAPLSPNSQNSQNSQAFAPSAAWPSGFFWPAPPAGRASLSGGQHSFRRSLHRAWPQPGCLGALSAVDRIPKGTRARPPPADSVVPHSFASNA